MKDYGVIQPEPYEVHVQFYMYVRPQNTGLNKPTYFVTVIKNMGFKIITFHKNDQYSRCITKINI